MSLIEIKSDIPARYTMTLEERRDHIYFAETNLEYRARFVELCRTDIVFFINTCCWTYDPRKDPDTGRIKGVIPFILWEAQSRAARRIFDAINSGHNLGQEKSRDQGLTWINLAVITQFFLFEEGFSALMSSYNENFNDNPKNHLTLGFKIDVLLDNLPSFLKSPTYNKDDNTNCRSYSQFRDPGKNTSITMAAPTEKFGIGGRATCAYLDDLGRWEHGGTAWQGLTDVTDCILGSWTPNPDDPMNHVYELRFGKGEFKNTVTPLLTIHDLHWTSDPRKQAMIEHPKQKGVMVNAWKFDRIGDPEYGIPGKITEKRFAYEADGVYEFAATGRIYSDVLRHVHIGDFPWDERFPTYTFWDYGTSDSCVILFAQWDWEVYRLRITECIVREGHGIAYYIPFVTGAKNKHAVLPMEVEYDEFDRKIIRRRSSQQRLDRRGEMVVRYTDHFGDPAGRQRSISHNKSAETVLGENGIFVRTRNDNEGKGYNGRIEATRQILPYVDIDKEMCAPLIEALQNYSWAKSTKGEKTQPLHDKYSHPCAALEYGAVNLVQQVIDDIRAREAQVAHVGRPGAVFGKLDALFVSDDDDGRNRYGQGRIRAGSRGPAGY